LEAHNTGKTGRHAALPFRDQQRVPATNIKCFFFSCKKTSEKDLEREQEIHEDVESEVQSNLPEVEASETKQP
jgi:hypothetical protein